MALYNYKGLSNFDIPDETAKEIDTEQELEGIINDINRFAEGENNLSPPTHVSDECLQLDIDTNLFPLEHQQDSSFTPLHHSLYFHH